MEDLLATSNYMPLTTVTVEEIGGIDRVNEAITIGIPFPQGRLYKASKLVLHDSMYACLPLQTDVLAAWPDKSLKWVLLDFQTAVKAKSIRELELILDESGTVSDKQVYISAEENPNYFFIDTRAAAFFVNRNIFRPFDRVIVGGKEIIDIQKSRTVLTHESGARYEPVIEHIFFETKGSLRVTLKAEGVFSTRDRSVFAAFSARIGFYANSSMVKIEFTILNPKAAKHPGGLWDLGDPGSIFFKDLSLYVALSTSEHIKTFWTSKLGTRNSQSSDHLLCIYQDSSGGKNWNSRNHLNRQGEVGPSFKGYRIYSDEKIIAEGERANPVISVTDGSKNICAGVQYFWQNFPKALEAKENTLVVRLFPRHCRDLFELQGGEQKTHSIFLDFGDSRSIETLEGLIQCPLVPRVTPEWYAKSKAFDFLIPEIEDREKQVTELINTAVKGNNTFFSRREIIDEYGWRNFGDLYADHEAVGHQGTEPLISHYNNQYDCIYGMLTQFARSGNYNWFVLADQLCSHVKDIDIYHTDEDRPEYNHGMFWHTYHYIDAQTATHRCFSKKHTESGNMGAYGGGPALSHNYSTGFLFHYYMTGSPSSKEAVSDSAAFIIANMDMADTLISRTVNRIRKIRMYLKRLFGKGNLVELRKVYELDGPGRASGNALNTLMNAYLLTNDQHYLERAENLIYQCINPHDDIESRDLLDTENRWMYTVFLQALGRYTDIKTREGDFDAMREYAVQSLIHYAKWMAENEYPYLEKPEKLEYPNETWAAQDVRKCNVLLYAAKYAEPEQRDFFLKKAGFFHNEAVKYLFAYDSKTLTRPIALMMLNAIMYRYVQIFGIEPVDSVKSSGHSGIRKPSSSSFSLEREIQFIKWRL